MSLTIDHSEQVTWQRQALAVLDTLLAQSLKTGTPRLLWTIGSAGVSLTGRSFAHPSTDRRGEIQAWADSLGLELREHRHPDGMITLTAHAKQQQFGKLWATITLICDIYPEDEDQDQAVTG
jgi:hypothetical protein